MRIGADALQLFFLVKAARAERQAQAQTSNCFVAGTEVETDANGVFGQEPIENVRVGDEVLSRDQYDPSAPAEARRVTAVFSHTAYALADVTVRGAAGTAETIRVTPEHPFYVDGLGWTASDQLAAGEHLSEADGTEATVVGVADEACPAGVTVYNFTVDGDHTYFVAQGGQPVWVHNSCEQPELPLGEDEAGYINNNPEATVTEQSVGRMLNNAAHIGLFDDVAQVEGNIESPPGSTKAPDYKVRYRNGSMGYADLYQPTSEDVDSIASNAMKKGKQTAGGLVIVRVPQGMNASALEAAIRERVATPGATKAGTRFYLLGGIPLTPVAVPNLP